MINRAASSAVNSQRASVFVKAQVNVREDESYWCVIRRASPRLDGEIDLKLRDSMRGSQ